MATAGPQQESETSESHVIEEEGQL
jgi:hypothetical protein